MQYLTPSKNKVFNWPKIVLVVIITLYMLYYLNSMADWHFINGVNLIFHEAGHAVFIFFGQFIHTLGGTIMQILVPLTFVIYFYRDKQYFSASLLMFWLSQSFFDVSLYAGDALKLELELLGGDNVYHDWNYLLSSLGILNYTDQVASLFYFVGIVILIFAVVFSIKFSFTSQVE